MSIRKILISSLTLVVLFVLYLIPSNKEEGKKIDLDGKESLEYVYNSSFDTIYLIDSDDYVSRTKIAVCACDDIIDKAKDLIEGLTIDGKKASIIPNGFRPIIPIGTTINSITLDNTTLKIDFSKELLEVNSQYEEKMIEAITYTLTTIDGVDGVIIYVDGELLTKLPNSGKNLPTFLDRSFGINKVYDLTTIKNIDSYTVFYVNRYNDTTYYVPVTKYINNSNQDKIEVIIEELQSAPIYESNLMSFLDTNAKLLDYEINDKMIKLNFNNMILNDIGDSSILEEVVYTVFLSLKDEYNIEELVFMIDNEEVYKTNINNIE